MAASTRKEIPLTGECLIVLFYACACVLEYVTNECSISRVSIATSQYIIVCTQAEANVSTSIDSCAKYVVYATTPIKTLIEWVPVGVLAEEM